MNLHLKLAVFAGIAGSVLVTAPAMALSPCSLLNGIASQACGLAYGPIKDQIKDQIKPEDFLKRTKSSKQRRVRPTASQRRKYGQNAVCYSSKSGVRCRRATPSSLNR